MAEGFSHKQSENDEHDILPPVAEVVGRKPDLSDRFKVFIGDLFRPKQEQYHEDEDDDEKDKHKGRFLRLFGRLFRGSIAQKEDIAHTAPETPQKSIFFEMTPTQHAEAGVQNGTEAPVDATRPVQDVEARTTTDAAHTEVTTPDTAAETTVDQPNSSEEQVDAADTRQNQLDEVVQLREAQTAQAVLRNEAPTGESPTPNTTESNRTKTVYTSRRTYYTQPDRPVFDLPPRQEKQPAPRPIVEANRPVAPDAYRPQSEAAVRPPQESFVKPPASPESTPHRKTHVEKIIQKNQVVIEKVPVETHEKNVDRRPNSQLHIEKRPETVRNPGVLKEVEKQELEPEDNANEIVYELSHEHKDADKQAAAAWAAVQASASTTAAQNAAAIAAAKAVGVNRPDGPTKSAKKQQSMYAQASMTGFVTAVVIAAIVLLLLLVTRDS